MHCVPIARFSILLYHRSSMVENRSVISRLPFAFHRCTVVACLESLTRLVCSRPIFVSFRTYSVEALEASFVYIIYIDLLTPLTSTTARAMRRSAYRDAGEKTQLYESTIINVLFRSFFFSKLYTWTLFMFDSQINNNRNNNV